MWGTIIDNMKMIGVCASALTACIGGYTYVGGPVPASKGFVLAQYDGLKGRVIDSQIQTNNLNASILKQEQVTRAADIVKETNPQVKSIYQNRLDDVSNELDKIHHDSDSLFKEKAALSK